MNGSQPPHRQWGTMETENQMTTIEAMALDLATYALKGTTADGMDITELADSLLEKCRDARLAIKEESPGENDEPADDL